MPELPEVEQLVRSLRARLVGRVIVGVTLHRRDYIREGAATFARSVKGRRVEHITRVGKAFMVALVKGDASSKGGARGKSGALGEVALPSATIEAHLGMTGSWMVVPSDAPLLKHTHIVLALDDGRELRIVDPRRFGWVKLAKSAPSNAPPSKDASTFTGRLGPDALDVPLNTWLERLAARRGRIKSVLLDQRVVAGVGNIYADEALFEARIHPKRTVEKLTRASRTRLWTALRRILEAAVAAGGSSIRSYVDGDGARGRYQQHHHVYGREGLPCLVCRTLIRREVIGGRSAHFCPKCQKLGVRN